MRVILIAIAAVLALPTAAQASLKVTWPQQRTYAPGETLSVKVVSTKPVRAALVRESASGKVMRTVARRTLRRGTFSATVPATGRYSLRIGNRARSVTVASSPPSAKLPAPPGPPCSTATGDRAELRLATATVRAGDTLHFAVVNTSAGCLFGGAAYTLERLLPDGSWLVLNRDMPFPAIAFILAAGTKLDKQAPIPADAAPGSYRVTDSLTGAAGAIPVFAAFEVVA